jgi:hypothetical protein
VARTLCWTTTTTTATTTTTPHHHNHYHNNNNDDNSSSSRSSSSSSSNDKANNNNKQQQQQGQGQQKMPHLQSNPATNATQPHDALTSVNELLRVAELDLFQIPCHCVVEMSLFVANNWLAQLPCHMETITALAMAAATAAVTTGRSSKVQK